MARKKLIPLAKELDFDTETEYFDYMIHSHINGSFSQCKELFSALKKEDQKTALKYIEDNTTKRIYDFYFNLI